MFCPLKWNVSLWILVDGRLISLTAQDTRTSQDFFISQPLLPSSKKSIFSVSSPLFSRARVLREKFCSFPLLLQAHFKLAVQILVQASQFSFLNANVLIVLISKTWKNKSLGWCNQARISFLPKLNATSLPGQPRLFSSFQMFCLFLLIF